MEALLRSRTASRMRVSHKQLEECRQQPRQWLVNSATGYSGPRKLGYSQVLQLAIYRYHKEQSGDAARRQLESLIARADFRNAARVDLMRADLDSYLNWHTSSGTITADHRVRLSLDLKGYLVLRGELSRVDITDEGYRGILLGVPQRRWQEQLRMPLLQRSLSLRYSRPMNEISIGIQDFDGSNLSVAQFSSRRIAEAEREFVSLGDQIRRLVT